MKIRPVTAELFHADGHDEAVVFRNSADLPQTHSTSFCLSRKSRGRFANTARALLRLSLTLVYKFSGSPQTKPYASLHISRQSSDQALH